MRNIIVKIGFFFVILIYSGVVKAQSIEMYGMSGWMFAGRTGPVKIINNVPYLAGIDYVLENNLAIGISYSWMNTDLELRDSYSGYTKGDRRGFQQGYGMLQVSRNFELSNEKLVPYTLFGVGLCHYEVKSPDFTTQVKLALGLGGGLKYMFNDKIGLKLQARLLSPIAGAGLYFGVGTGGVSSGVSTYSYLVQLETTGGLVFKF